MNTARCICAVVAAAILVSVECTIPDEPHGVFCAEFYIGVARFRPRVFVDKFERTVKFKDSGWLDIPMCRRNVYVRMLIDGTLTAA